MPEYDTVFSLPAVDEEPETEIGVLLMGMAPDRLLAGLGVAGGDPVTATLVVDQLRHGARPDMTFDDATAEGAARWRAARARLSAAAPTAGYRSAALRRRWADAVAVVTAAAVTDDAARRVYLAACWLRHADVDRLAGLAPGN